MHKIEELKQFIKDNHNIVKVIDIYKDPDRPKYSIEIILEGQNGQIQCCNVIKIDPNDIKFQKCGYMPFIGDKVRIDMISLGNLPVLAITDIFFKDGEKCCGQENQEEMD